MRKPWPERYWQYVAKGESCWNWTGATNGSGYGIICVNGRSTLAHRIAWQLATGVAPDKCVLHKCDNRLCQNTDHLFLGTVADNNKDMTRKGRHGMSKKTSCPRGHPFSPENTYVYRGLRACRTCIRRRWSKQPAKIGGGA